MLATNGGAGADEWFGTSKASVEMYLKQTFGADNREVFFDRHLVILGANWRSELRDGLDRAPILIPFFSPGYFNSDYCVAELKTFMTREDHLDLERGTLIHAARTHDKNHFPSWARDIQARDFCEFFLLGPTFEVSEVRHGFDEALKEFTTGAGDKIKHVANNVPHQPDFPKLPNVPDPVE
ncbi:MAG: toll/interleukin-1 receptor domain-containing protein [Paracoccaceae bacterium]|nr:toll/interleukin-1 receptor domain-containing protein [Paracoccaceae bacterium]